MKTSTTTFSYKNRIGHVTTTQYVVSREPATLNEAKAVRPEWYQEIGQAITGASVVRIDCSYLGEEHFVTTYYLEVETATGRAILPLGYTPEASVARPGAMLIAFVPNDKGRRAFMHGCFVDRKHGRVRGEAVVYLQAHGWNPNSNKKVDKCSTLCLWGACRGGI